MPTKHSRIAEVMAHVRQQIAARQLLPASRLLSVRAQAQALGYSVSTVVEAYERLVAEGLLLSKPGAGFFVAGPVAPLALAQLGRQLDREVDPLWISRQALDSDESLLKPGCGWLPAQWMYEAGMRRALRQLARGDDMDLVEYATPLGLPELRLLLGRRMAAHGMEVAPENILLTESGTHAIDLICRFFLEAGDTVLVDDPCYFNFHALLKAHRVQVVGVPYTPNGPDLVAFEAALAAHQPRLYITNSGIHNPTGAVLSPVVAHKLLKLVDGSQLLIVEDDIFADLEQHPAPRLSVFDGLERVLSIGSFSKTVSASLRCGYIAAKSEWVEGLADLKIATSFGGGQLAARVLQAALTDSGYRKHMDSVRLHLAKCRQQVLPRLMALGIQPWLQPQAGMFVWCRLPDGKDAATVARLCLVHGVVLAPGNVFSLSTEAGQFVRFNVAQCLDERVFAVLQQVLKPSSDSQSV